MTAVGHLGTATLHAFHARHFLSVTAHIDSVECCCFHGNRVRCMSISQDPTLGAASLTDVTCIMHQFYQLVLHETNPCAGFCL